MGDRNSLLVTLGNVVAGEPETRRVEMGKTLINGFLPTHDKGNLAQEQVTAIGSNLIKGATEFEAMEHLGFDVRAQEQSEGLMGKELRAQRQGPIGKAQAVANPSFARFPWGDRLLVVGLATRVDQAYESSIADDRSYQAQVI